MAKEGDGSFVKWFSELKKEDVALVGSKGASLAEIYNNGFPVPPGFVITIEAYKYFIEKNKLSDIINNILKGIDITDASALEKSSAKIREIIENAEIPPELEEVILDAYDILDIKKENLKEASQDVLDILKSSHEPSFVAVRSSLLEDGKGDSFLNVKENQSLIEHIKKAFVSLFSERSIKYKRERGLSNEQSSIAVIVQRMVDANKSGKIYSKNPSGKNDNIIINAIFGLGEGFVSENIKPDNYFVNKDLKLLESRISDKKVAVARNSAGEREVIKLGDEISKREVLTGHEIKMLSQFAKRLEDYYGEPQDIEFAIDNENIFIVQTRAVRFEVEEEEEAEEEEKVEKEREEEIKIEKDKEPEVKAEVGELREEYEEEEILKALEEAETLKKVPDLIPITEIEALFKGTDEYEPSLGTEEKAKADIPKLNEAIPISSEDFEEDKEEEVIDFDEKALEKVFGGGESEEEIDSESEETEEEILNESEDEEQEKQSPGIFEKQQEAKFEEEIEKEVEESGLESGDPNKNWEEKSEKEKEKEFLDIF